MEWHEEGGPASYTCLKILVKKYLERKTRDRNFDARNDQIASCAMVKQEVSVKFSVKFSVKLSVKLYVKLSVCLCLSLSVSVCQFVSPTQSLSVSLYESLSVSVGRWDCTCVCTD